MVVMVMIGCLVCFYVLGKIESSCLFTDSSPYYLLFYILETTDLERSLFFILKQGTGGRQRELESHQIILLIQMGGFPGNSAGKESPAMQETLVQFPGQKDPRRGIGYPL